MVRPPVISPVPWLGVLTASTVRVSPSTSESLANTGITTASIPLVVAWSSAAIGASLPLVTVTVTASVAVSVPAVAPTVI